MHQGHTAFALSNKILATPRLSDPLTSDRSMMTGTVLGNLPELASKWRWNTAASFGSIFLNACYSDGLGWVLRVCPALERAGCPPGPFDETLGGCPVSFFEEFAKNCGGSHHHGAKATDTPESAVGG